MSAPAGELGELAELVAEARDLAEAWSAVGARQLPWERPEPGWPALPSPDAGRAPPPRPADRTAPAGPEPVRLFPEQAPKPRSIPPRPAEPGALGRWQGYGAGASPERGLEEVRQQLGECRRCALHRGRRNLVFGVGDPAASLVVVGEAPGFHEDQQGEPFVGAAGQMLDRMLENVLFLRRDQVYIMNVLKCRPPENRDPQPDEMSACRPFLDAQLNAIRPKAILALGRFAAQSLLETPQGIKALRGRWGLYRGIPVMPTFHPAYLLRTPDDKRLTMEDLVSLRARLGIAPPKR